MGRIMGTDLAIWLKHSIQNRNCKVARTVKELILQNFFSVLHSLKANVVLEEQGGRLKSSLFLSLWSTALTDIAQRT